VDRNKKRGHAVEYRRPSPDTATIQHR